MGQATPEPRIAYAVEVDAEILRMMPDLLMQDGQPRTIKLEQDHAVLVPGRIVAIDLDTMELFGLDSLPLVSHE